jgi:hypothetical protein
MRNPEADALVGPWSHRGSAILLVLTLLTSFSEPIAAGETRLRQSAPADSDRSGEDTWRTTVGLALRGEEAERFLRTARVVAREPVPVGVTRPERLTLSDGARTLRASWKTIDERKLGLARIGEGRHEFDFRDSWKSEVAAYELDKLLGLGLVPPTVEREITGHRGALQLWVEGVMTEKDRQKQGIAPEQVPSWNNQMHCVRLFHQLTYNTDFQNIANILVDPTHRIYLIDSSRAFRVQKDLLAEDDLVCFSRRALERLEGLDEETLNERLGRWLDRLQIEGLLARRDQILVLVQRRVEKKGPGPVLFP